MGMFTWASAFGVLAPAADEIPVFVVFRPPAREDVPPALRIRQSSPERIGLVEINDVPHFHATHPMGDFSGVSPVSM